MHACFEWQKPLVSWNTTYVKVIGDSRKMNEVLHQFGATQFWCHSQTRTSHHCSCQGNIEKVKVWDESHDDLSTRIRHCIFLVSYRHLVWSLPSCPGFHFESKQGRSNELCKKWQLRRQHTVMGFRNSLTADFHHFHFMTPWRRHRKGCVKHVSVNQARFGL